MIRFRGRVQMVSGELLEFDTGTAALAAWEEYAKRHGHPYNEGAPAMLMTLCIAHHALAIEQGFDAWRESVDGAELDEQDAVTAYGPDTVQRLAVVAGLEFGMPPAEVLALEPEVLATMVSVLEERAQKTEAA